MPKIVAIMDKIATAKTKNLVREVELCLLKVFFNSLTPFEQVLNENFVRLCLKKLRWFDKFCINILAKKNKKLNGEIVERNGLWKKKMRKQKT